MSIRRRRDSGASSAPRRASRACRIQYTVFRIESTKHENLYRYGSTAVPRPRARYTTGRPASIPFRSTGASVRRHGAEPTLGPDGERERGSAGLAREGARRRPPPGPRALAARSQQARRAQARLQAAVLAVQVGHERVGRVQARQQPLRRALRVRRARAQRRRLRAPRARGALRGGHALTPTLLRTTSHHTCLTVRLQTLIPTHDTYTATRLCSREGRTTPTLAFRGINGILKLARRVYGSDRDPSRKLLTTSRPAEGDSDPTPPRERDSTNFNFRMTR